LYLLITIDTEGDNPWAGKGCDKFTQNARFLPRFQQLCETFDYKPTYLTTYEMAKDEFFAEFARDAIRRQTCEIGAHPHPWSSPPAYDLTGDDMKYHPYVTEYPQDIIREKVKALTEVLQNTFDTTVCSHRAGRWGFNEVYANILTDLRYKVDCSVTPFETWKSSKGTPAGTGGPDYRHFPAEPYFLDDKDISQPGDSPLLEIPVTVIPRYGRMLWAIYNNVIPQASKPARFAFKKIFGPSSQWFRPARGKLPTLMKVAERTLESNADYIMFMLHSCEFMPGGSPQFRNKEEIDALYEAIQQVFQWLYEHGVKGLTCQQFYNVFTAEKI